MVLGRQDHFKGVRWSILPSVNDYSTKLMNRIVFLLSQNVIFIGPILGCASTLKRILFWSSHPQPTCLSVWPSSDVFK